MVFSINKKDIIDRLQNMISIIPSKTTMMVLSNLKLEADAESNQIIMTATDLNLTTIVKIPANVIENGALLVPAKHLGDIISALPESLINFSLRDDHLFIECEKSNFTISYIEASMFPEITFVNSDVEYIFNAEKFKKVIQNSSFCASTETAQPIYTGVYLKLEDNLVTMAATDTKRIGEAKYKVEFTNGNPYEIILPTRALSFIEKNINHDIGDLIIKYDDRRISFMMNNVLLISNKYEGKYPNYSVAFRNPPIYTLMLDRDVFRDAVRRVSLLSEDLDRLIKMSLTSNEIKIESLISERGNAKEVISGFTYDGPEDSYGLNSKFLMSILNAIETDEVLLKFRSTNEPIWFLNNDEFDSLEIRFILMPMKIDKTRSQ